MKKALLIEEVGSGWSPNSPQSSSPKGIYGKEIKPTLARPHRSTLMNAENDQPCLEALLETHGGA
jgi:hypothetical protein